MAHSNTSNSEWGKEVTMLIPSSRTRKLALGIQHVKAEGKHDHIMINNTSANMTMKSNPSPVKGETRTILG